MMRGDSKPPNSRGDAADQNHRLLTKWNACWTELPPSPLGRGLGIKNARHTSLAQRLGRRYNRASLESDESYDPSGTILTIPAREI
jgi:hypothetical protein